MDNGAVGNIVQRDFRPSEFQLLQLYSPPKGEPDSSLAASNVLGVSVAVALRNASSGLSGYVWGAVVVQCRLYTSNGVSLVVISLSTREILDVVKQELEKGRISREVVILHRLL